MEAKFWAGLTENQPNACLARLPLDERSAVLLFVAPEATTQFDHAEGKSGSGNRFFARLTGTT